MRKKTALLTCAAMLATAISTFAPTPAWATSARVTFAANGHQYQMISQRLNWDEAVAASIQMGGHLATITSKAENDFVFSLLGSTTFAWLGATDRDVEGTWKWVTGEPFTYTNWYPGEPNNCTNEDYLHIEAWRAPAVWNDILLPGPAEKLGSLGFVVEWETPTMLDVVPPTVTASPVRPPDSGSTGWYTTPVTLRWNVTDDHDSPTDLTPPPDTIANREGKAVTYTSTPACDRAGNCATGTAVISLDTAAPTVRISGVADGGSYALAAVPTSSCSASDGTSGLAAPCTGTTSGGTGIGIGTFTYTATATDIAGNTATKAATYQVTYPWSGFLPSIVDTAHQVGTSISVFKAGQTVPVKFQLRDAAGSLILPQTAPMALVPQRLGPIDQLAQVAAGAPTVSTAAYRLSDETWIYNWNTRGLQAGYWYRIGVRLDDGTIHDAIVGLR